MFLTRKHLSRREVLKGAGATIALPLLDAMIPARTALAQTVATGHRDTLLQADHSWNGIAYTHYPTGRPQLTTIKLTMAQTFPLVRPGVDLPPDALERRFLAT